MKKNLPLPVVIGVIVVVLVIVGVIYAVAIRPKDAVTDANGLPIGERHQPPAGWSIDGGAPAQPGPQGPGGPQGGVQ